MNLYKDFKVSKIFYCSFDNVVNDTTNHYPSEYFKLFKTKLVKSTYAYSWNQIRLCNIHPSYGLCNGRSFICREFQKNAIDVETLVV